MKIWIDLTNSPHVNFFKPFIVRWQIKGFKVIITTRNLSNTIDLIKLNKWKYFEVGNHAGKNMLRKILYFPRRVTSLLLFLKNIRPDIGISHSSFYSPIVCKLLGIPSIYLNDNEHAKGNYLAFRFASINIVPEVLYEKAKEWGWLKRYKIQFYPGIKEGIYLSQSNIINQTYTLKDDSKKIYIRLEPRTAEYYSGKNYCLDKLIVELNDIYQVIILPRDRKQANHYLLKNLKNVVVAERPVMLEEIYEKCHIFIGAGGSMTRELSYLGVPTVSIYQGELLEVDKYLINNNFMYYNKKPKIEDIKIFLNNIKLVNNSELTNKGREAFNLINNIVFDYVKN